MRRASSRSTPKVTTAIGTGYDVADALVVQPDGKIRAVGTGGTYLDFAIVRYLGSPGCAP